VAANRAGGVHIRCIVQVLYSVGATRQRSCCSLSVMNLQQLKLLNWLKLLCLKAANPFWMHESDEFYGVYSDEYFEIVDP